MPLPADPSSLVVLGFALLSPAVLLLILYGAYRVRALRPTVVVGAVLWAGLGAGLAASGVLAHFDPPRLLVLLVLGTALMLWFGLRGPGQRMAMELPLAALIAFQVFRIPVEILIHHAGMEGIAPMEMSWSGYNFDILTGLTAPIVAILAKKLPVRALHFWNFTGLFLLLWVVSIAVLAMPSPFQQLATDPPNIWVVHFPFVWLPTILVLSAGLGHLLVYRRLSATK